MERWLAHFLEMRIRVRRRPALTALVDRCLSIIARADGASETELDVLEAEVEALRRELEARLRGARLLTH